MNSFNEPRNLAQLRYVRCETPSSPLRHGGHSRDYSEENLRQGLSIESGFSKPAEDMLPVPVAPVNNQTHGVHGPGPATFMYPSRTMQNQEPRPTVNSGQDSDFQELRHILQTHHPPYSYNNDTTLMAYHSSDSLDQIGTSQSNTGLYSLGLQIADGLYSKILEHSDTMDDTLPEFERLLAGFCFMFGPSSRIYSRQALQYCYHRSFDDAHGECFPLFRRVLNNHFVERWPLEQPRRAAFTVETYWYHDLLSLEETVFLAQQIATHLPVQQWWEDCDDWMDIASIFHSRGLYHLAEPYMQFMLTRAKDQLDENAATFFRASPRCTSNVLKAISTHARGSRNLHNLQPGSSFPHNLQALRLAISTTFEPTKFDYFQMRCWVSLAASFCACTQSPGISMDMFRALRLRERMDVPAGPNGTEFFGLYASFEELWSTLLGTQSYTNLETADHPIGRPVDGGEVVPNVGWKIAAKEVVVTVVNALERWLPEDNWSVIQARRVLLETFEVSGRENPGQDDMETGGDIPWDEATNWMVDWEGNVEGSNWSSQQSR